MSQQVSGLSSSSSSSSPGPAAGRSEMEGASQDPTTSSSGPATGRRERGASEGSTASSLSSDPGPAYSESSSIQVTSPNRNMEGARGRKRSPSPASQESPQHKKPREESSSESEHQFPTQNTRSLLEQLVSPDDPHSKVEVYEKIGEGAFGAVWTGATKDPVQKVAIKLQPLDQHRISPRIITEISIMKTLSHESIAQYIDTYIADDILWIVMDFVDGLTIEKITEYNNYVGEQMPTRFISAILKGIVQGLAYLHGVNIIHRDLKGANVIVAKSGTVKIVYFGLSTEEGGCMDQCGTLLYMAPEVVKRINYTRSIDVWSLGMTAVELVNNDKPYREYTTAQDVKEKIVNNILPIIHNENRLPHVLKHFIRSCLNAEPNARKTATQLKTHALFSFFKASATELGNTIADIQVSLQEIELSDL